jgi:hypothetical protein
MRTWGIGPIGVSFIAFVFLVVGCSRCHSGHHRRHRARPLARSVDLHPVQFAIISIVSLAFDKSRHLWSLPDDFVQ